ncbi:MAG: NAD-glutamate dehydrogenase [Alphaproteobacteria bacterium]|nr:NAD-glutamate dehydrogenase [Alphaproteobacteria bacterium]
MSFNTSQEKKQKLQEVANRLHRLSKLGEEGSLVAFAERFYEWVAPEDLTSIPIESLAGSAHSMWRFGQQRPANKPLVRVFDPTGAEHGWPSPHTVIEIINDDMPFLVDSVTANLERHNIQVHLVIHPIISVVRHKSAVRVVADGSGTRESWIHVEIERQPDAKRRDAIASFLQAAFSDVRAAVADWKRMIVAVRQVAVTLKVAPKQIEASEIAETREFLDWVADNHFTLLGYCRFDYVRQNKKESFKPVKGTGLGILRRSETMDVVGKSGCASEIREFLKQPIAMIVTKAGKRSTVHRAAYLDYIGVKRFDGGGVVIGEDRFVGLFTSTAYRESPTRIPYLRRKVAQAMERSKLPAGSHAVKALLDIIETYPRDELFQMTPDELYEAATGILRLEDHPRTRLFVRSDRFKRFAACLVYVPREKHTTELRLKYAKTLAEAFNGRASAFYTHIGDDALARLHFIIGRTPETTLEPDPIELEAKLVAAGRTWDERLKAALIASRGENDGATVYTSFANAFGAAYQAVVEPEDAVVDLERIAALKSAAEVDVRLYRRADGREDRVHAKLYRIERQVVLSECMPMLEHLGVRVNEEQAYQINTQTRPGGWIHDFELEHPLGQKLDLESIRSGFEDAFEAVWRGDAEDDGFNALVIRAGLSWRQVVIVRAYAKYFRQINVPFSQELMEQTLIKHAPITRKLVELFEARFNVAAGLKPRDSSKAVAVIESALAAVENLDEDRILRRYLNLMVATLRTNYYQPAANGGQKPYVSFKLDSKAVDGLPLPKPLVEIWVYAPRVEGIHLRGGRVARGGLRWSDRRDDFRTEVLGLFKAQMVKNAVIVPVGSKGGFVPKRLPAGSSREAIQAEGIESYKMFLSGLLDVTDNLLGGKPVAPKSVVRYDGDDPYLVVAADKGTATFSDIANGVAHDYGFWLGDAFASGGSVGYDHKKMGITAKGGWESVKRHFRELGVDCQTTDFTCAGIGDMAGDVFGNGLLRSCHTKLIAAFNHLHIFIDPDPNPAASFKERERLFALPRSAWTDYNAKLISKGGGVFDRKAKSIKLSVEARRALAIEGPDTLTPAQLVNAILKAPVDLLWNGGIGTYVKSSSETNAEVGDRANDALRVNGGELRCKIIGEGGNLGCTQRGRIEAALSGVRLNTDAIDNSAGVDCSDHEVNIKILLGALEQCGKFKRSARDKLLASMTDEVGELVLSDNYLQTQAISFAQAHAVERIDSDARFIRELERRGQLDRAVEYLPSDEEIAERQAAGKGLTRPEIAVLLAYAKMTLYDAILASNLPDERYLIGDLQCYFPKALCKKYGTAMENHQLRREIIATFIANSIVNRAGHTFVSEMFEDGKSVADIARAYTIVREVFDLRSLWHGIEALDNKTTAKRQIAMISEVQRLIFTATRWFLTNVPAPLAVEATVAAFAPGIKSLAGRVETLVAKIDAAKFAENARAIEADAVPRALAGRIAELSVVGAGLHIVQAAKARKRSVDDVARVYFELGARLGLDWLRSQAEDLVPRSSWEQKALAAIIDDLYGQQRALASRVIELKKGAAPAKMIEVWENANRSVVTRSQDLINEFKTSGGMDIARLAIANRQVQAMIVGTN